MSGSAISLMYSPFFALQYAPGAARDNSPRACLAWISGGCCEGVRSAGQMMYWYMQMKWQMLPPITNR